MAKKTAGRSLKTYQSKRDFKKSPEPKSTTKPTAAGRSFCVQKHLASHLHYDFRLEHNGVLISWAVPKGPSLNPADKRMAVHVEDHPVDYGNFEGVIPSGYGAGVVLLWDRGTWQPDAPTTDVDAAIANGELKFTVDGTKLKGSWVLVRTRRQTKGPERWLLIKHRDKWSGQVDVTAELPQSVKSFGDLPDILAAAEVPEDWKIAPPVRGGETGRLLATVMAKADKLRSGKTAARALPATNKSAAPRARPTTSKPALTAEAAPQPKLSNQTKILYPATGFTKGNLVGYYRRAAPLILPHLAGRAVTLKRFPDGVDGKSFFEKRCASHRPDWVKTFTVARSGDEESIAYCAIENEPTLVWAANLAAIELHVPLALAKNPDRPTAMVFDLDPGPPATVADCVPIALRLKSLLDHLQLESALKTSGGKGLHLLVPLDSAGVTFDQTKSFARAIAITLEKDDPKKVISSMTRAARGGKIFIDWSQNDRNKTTVCAYSVRARPDPTVSWPLPWEKLSEKKPPVSPSADKADFSDPFLPTFLDVLSKTQKLPKDLKL
jgi:bifunctional non-homologous end joining protein LigD